MELDKLHPPHPRLSQGRASSSTTSCPCCRMPRHCSYAVDQLGGVRAGAGRSTWSSAPRLAASSWARLWRMPLGVGFAAARKPGKLPWKVNRCEYDLEYGTDALEMHADAIKPGQRVLIHDDLLATGGTAKAKIQLVEEAGGVVAGLAFIIELTELGGRDRLEGYDVFSLLQLPVLSTRESPPSRATILRLVYIMHIIVHCDCAQERT